MYTKFKNFSFPNEVDAVFIKLLWHRIDMFMNLFHVTGFFLYPLKTSENYIL